MDESNCFREGTLHLFIFITKATTRVTAKDEHAATTAVNKGSKKDRVNYVSKHYSAE